MKLPLKILIILIVVVLLIIGVPILINEMYNIGGYVTHWGASETLGYYGSILGGFATLIAIYITIKYENKKMRNENIKRENERKREMAIQRLNFVSSNLRLMLSKIDNQSIILDTFKDNIFNWMEKPQEIYELYNDLRSMININKDFTYEENKLIEDEYKELQEYAKVYTNLLLDFYNLLIERKNLKLAFDSNTNMCKLIISSSKLRLSRIDEFIKKIATEQSDEEKKYIRDISQEIQKNIDEFEEIRIADEDVKGRLDETYSLICKAPENFFALFNEKYSNLLPTIKKAEEKLKNKIDVSI
ncbi:MAG: hypothetical protein FWD82_05905 [Defluviitaleaceae bacterium]|nr:hypothetical protein [Defluviitaleaceae bacterium]